MLEEEGEQADPWVCHGRDNGRGEAGDGEGAEQTQLSTPERSRET